MIWFTLKDIAPSDIVKFSREQSGISQFAQIIMNYQDTVKVLLHVLKTKLGTVCHDWVLCHQEIEDLKGMIVDETDKELIDVAREEIQVQLT